MTLRRIALSIAAILVGANASAQTSDLGAELHREHEEIAQHCTGVSPKPLMNCAMTLVTGHPIHIALGSLAPRNGFALGLAFGSARVPGETWRLTWSADAVGSFSGAWRAGGYLKLIHTPLRVIGVGSAGSGTPPGAPVVVKPHTVINVYGQVISLHTLFFYGIGNDTDQAGQSVFGMRETIVGSNTIVPVNSLGALNLALLGEVNGRFVNIRDGSSAEFAGIRTLYTDATAPGLATQPGVFQAGEGARLRPSLFGDHLSLDYSILYQQYLSSGDSSFERATLDLNHEIPLYKTTVRVHPRDTLDPNDCTDCLSVSHDRSGTISARIVYVSSFVPDGHVAPFYFQPTLGGSDINGQSSLQSYNDYRFRGPNLLLFRQTFEHSVYGPVGLYLQADEAKVAVSREDLNTRDLKRSFAVGATLRAGGFPQLTAAYGWGGSEGRHFSLTMSTSLLGGSSRPKLD